MGIAILKKLNSKLPDSIKIAFAPIIRKKLIKNAVFLNEYKKLCDAENCSKSELRQLQFVELKNVLIHAYEHTNYYKKLFDHVGFNAYQCASIHELEKIPYLSKELIINNFEDLQADDIKDFYPAMTGGSTGSPLKILLDRDSIYKERAFVYHFWNKLGYDYQKSRVASFRGTDFSGRLSKFNPLYNEIQLNPCTINGSTIYEYSNLMDKFGVEYLHGFPSAIYSFCRFSKSFGIDLTGKYKGVFFISENVYPFQREFIEETLGCKSLAFFGHSERNVFAEEYDGLYKFNDLYGVWSIHPEDHEIICTGFLNAKMPLIRYRLDDTALANGEYYSIKGHRDGTIYGKNSELISAAALEVHSNILDLVSNYQFEQYEKGKLIIRVIPFQKLSQTEIDSINRLFQEKVGESLDIYVEIVTSMVYTQRGKFILVIQHIQ